MSLWVDNYERHITRCSKVKPGHPVRSGIYARYVTFPPQYEELFDKRRSHETDFRIATKLCEDQVVFWAPKVVWNWQSTSHSNRAGWFVRAMSMHEK